MFILDLDEINWRYVSFFKIIVIDCLLFKKYYFVIYESSIYLIYIWLFILIIWVIVVKFILWLLIFCYIIVMINKKF